MHVTLVPMKVARQELEWIGQDLRELGIEPQLAPPMVVPASAYDARRRQYRADMLLQAARLAPGEHVLGVCDVDLFVTSLNYVLGLAELPGRTGVIGLARLRRGADPERFRARMLKEAVHELGHTLGLQHCDDPACVMHFSNTLADTDRKGRLFCPRCQAKLSRPTRPVPAHRPFA